MFASLLTAALAASSVVAAPVHQARKVAPDHWSNNRLEDYLTYHTRYVALECSKKHDTDFFDECCRPLSASQSLDDREDYCRPSQDALDKAAARISQKAAANGDNADAPSPADKVEEDDQAAEAFSTASTSVAAEPTSEAAAAAPTQEAAAPPTEQKSSGGPTFKGGQATHFTPWDGTGVSFSAEPQLGNCGMKWGDFGGLNGNWVALKTSLYDGGKWCGKQVRLTTPDGKSSVGTILDSCPSCHDEGHIDISPNMFNELQSTVQIPVDSDEQPSNDPGILTVDWEILG